MHSSAVGGQICCGCKRLGCIKLESPMGRHWMAACDSPSAANLDYGPISETNQRAQTAPIELRVEVHHLRFAGLDGVPQLSVRSQK
eukprot:gene8067-biopygen14482